MLVPTLSGNLCIMIIVTTSFIELALSKVKVSPPTGLVTLVPGNSIHFKCDQVSRPHAEFRWYWIPIGKRQEVLLEPRNDDDLFVSNDGRMRLVRPGPDLAGDYFCRVQADIADFGHLKVRTQPYIEEFGQLEGTSHTGNSITVTEGDRLELLCTMRDKITPVNITWLRSKTPDDSRDMVPLLELPRASASTAFDGSDSENHLTGHDSLIKTFLAQEQSVIVEGVDENRKKLVIESIKSDHRSHYGCIADDGVHKTQRVVFIRVKDKLVALWPFLGIVALLFILFTIIYVWESQRVYREMLFNQRSENRLLQ